MVQLRFYHWPYSVGMYRQLLYIFDLYIFHWPFAGQLWSNDKCLALTKYFGEMYHKNNLTCFFNYFVNVSFQFYSFFFCPFHCMYIFHINKNWTTMINFKVAGDKHFDDKFCVFVNPLLKLISQNPKLI